MQKKILNKSLLYLFIYLFISACSSIPKYPQNACKIFGENYLWYKSVKKSSEKYGAPIHIILAFVNKESGFNRWAKPKRTKLFKIVPYKRPSSSFGYSQAVNKTWELYKTETENPLALRARFKDSVMFIGWYIKKTNKINKIPLNDPYRQYLNYYLGWGNYSKEIYKTDKKSILFAKKVEKQSKIYKKQLKDCKKSLDRNKYIIF
ncbi:MAG: hypothetical protein FD545_000339 [Pelagibacterales bacterium]|nr:hypothetical protein [Pelagibacterales bacterium]